MITQRQTRMLAVYRCRYNSLICRSRSQSCTGRRQPTCTRRLFRSTCRPRKHLKQRQIHISWPTMLPVMMIGSALVRTGIIFVSCPPCVCLFGRCFNSTSVEWHARFSCALQCWKAFTNFLTHIVQQCFSATLACLCCFVLVLRDVSRLCPKLTPSCR